MGITNKLIIWLFDGLEQSIVSHDVLLEILFPFTITLMYTQSQFNDVTCWNSVSERSCLKNGSYISFISSYWWGHLFFSVTENKNEQITLVIMCLFIIESIK